MDSGVLEEGDALDDDIDVAQHLSPEEAVWVIDQLMCREVSAAIVVCNQKLTG
jgi:hypothetical protein